MRTQKSAGFVIFKREGKGIKYLLLHHGGSYWNFAKGRLEAGETDMEAALRELEEETGITEVKVTKDFQDQYDYDFDVAIEDGTKETIYKTAVFFMAEVDDGAVKISDEHVDHGWFDFNTAKKRLFFQNGQDVLQRAHNFLLKENDFVL